MAHDHNILRYTAFKSMLLARPGLGFLIPDLLLGLLLQQSLKYQDACAGLVHCGVPPEALPVNSACPLLPRDAAQTGGAVHVSPQS